MRNTVLFSLFMTFIFYSSAWAQDPCENDTTPLQIIWPSDITVESSEHELMENTLPSELAFNDTYDPLTDTGFVYGEPNLVYDCELPGVNYTDRVYVIDSNTREILRTWKVVDWNDLSYIETSIQSIWVNLLQDPCANDTTPVVVEKWPADITVTSEENNVDQTINPANLGQYNSFDPGTGQGEVYDEPLIDYDCERIGVNYTDLRRIINQDEWQITRTWKYLDWDSGQTDSADQIINVLLVENPHCENDTLEPIAVCEQGITLTLDSSGSAILTESMVDAGSFDLCGIDTMFLSQYSFDETYLGGPHPVTLTVMDEAGNSNQCWTEVFVEQYDTTSQVQICIQNPLGWPMEGVEVTQGKFTNPQGCVNIQRGETLVLELNDDPREGVDMIDMLIHRRIVLAQIQGIPEQYIAGDVNKSESFTSYDWFAMQELIFGEIDDFFGFDSWSFWLRDFSSGTNPYDLLPLTEENLDTAQNTIVLTGVKLGDLDFSSHSADSTVPSKSPLVLTAEDIILNRGVTYAVPFYSVLQEETSTYEFSFGYEGPGFQSNGINILDIRSDIVAEDGFSYRVENNRVYIKIFAQSINSVPLNEEVELFSILFTAGENSILSNELFFEDMEINSTVGLLSDHSNLYFLDFEWDGEIILNNRENDLNTSFTVFPNPVTQQWMVEGEINQPATFELVDMFGRKVLEKEFQGSALLNRGNLPAGIYIYQISGLNLPVQTGQLIITE
ncbi:MAG TPA: T9SS type A sorting domain-containing protein [Saprospiraceae bacterium]|nr:T9SS type A sorting domain-containing protein [Saprospiraceae bacterium]